MGSYLTMGLLVEAREPKGERPREGRQSKEAWESVLGKYVLTEMYDLDETSGGHRWRLKEEFLGRELVDYLRWQLGLWGEKEKETEGLWEGLLASASWDAVCESMKKGGGWNLRWQTADARHVPYTSGLLPLDLEVLVFATDGKISAEGLGFVSYLRRLLKTQASLFPLVSATLIWIDG